MDTKPPLIIANWKMNGDLHDSTQLLEELKNISYENLIICPPHTLLYSANKIFSGTNLGLGAQDISKNDPTSGPYTGDISAAMISGMGCKYVIIGHSERRVNNNESNNDIHEKIKNAHLNGLCAILCIGENLQEREQGMALATIEKQLASIPNSANYSNLIIAYEPVWAIGAKKSADAHIIAEIVAHIDRYLRKEIEKNFNILYGGSVNKTNIESILSIEGVSGALIGALSLKIDEFKDIIGIASRI